GPWALVPVLATALFILAGANRRPDAGAAGRMPLPNRLLAARPLVTLGAMAYSLYLWHWPLLIVWRAYTGHAPARVPEGAVVLLRSGLLAYLTNRHVEDPLRYRAPAATGYFASVASEPMSAVPWRVRLRRPTMALGSVVALLGVTLTVTSFSWREEVTLQRASGKELTGLNPQDYPGARALLTHERVPLLRMRPTVLESRDDLPPSTRDGCISDFTNSAVLNCTYGDRAATQTIALAGGSHAEHWLTALDLLGRLHHFKVVTYLKMGCPLSTTLGPMIACATPRRSSTSCSACWTSTCGSTPRASQRSIAT
ncbi:MAG: conserved rane protein, partial [Ilumatobacteraceae bacterium]|nr:conserved rane protein [Ilumatobacteraceae bacterium]